MRIRRKKQQPNSQTTIQPQRSQPPTQNQTEQATDLLTLQQQAEQPGRNFGDISIFSAQQSANPVPLQAKLTIGQPNDKYEQEADRVAADVVQTINSPEANQSVQKTEEEELQAKPLHLQADGMTAAASAAPPEVEKGINSAKGGGQPLAPNLQQKMGNAMGADFSGVRVHTDNNANKLNESIQAKAFTTGRDVFFKQGAYQPNSKGGQELIAHELTHVVQQGGSQNLQRSLGSKVIQRQVFDDDDKAQATPLKYEEVLKKISDLEAVKSLKDNDRILKIIQRLVRVATLFHKEASLNGNKEKPKFTLSEVKKAINHTIKLYQQWYQIKDDNLQNNSSNESDEKAAEVNNNDFKNYNFEGKQLKDFVSPFDDNDNAKEIAQWLEIKFVQKIGKNIGDIQSASHIAYISSKTGNTINKIICAVGASAIVAGFVPDPSNYNQVILGSQEMAGLLHETGKQANALNVQEAHAIAKKFSPLFRTQVSSVYNVQPITPKEYLEIKDIEQKTKEKIKAAAITKESLSNILKKLNPGDRLYIGKQDGWMLQDNKNGGKNIEALGGHAYAILKNDDGKLIKYETNGGHILSENEIVDELPPDTGICFQYFIVKHGSKNNIDEPNVDA